MNHSKHAVVLIALSSFAGCSGGGGSTGNGSGGSAGGGTKSNPPAGTAYVGLFGDNAVAVVDTASSHVVATIPVPAPDGLVITADGAKVYVSSNNSSVVEVIDTATQSVTASIEVGTQPAGLSLTPDGKYVVVSVQGDGQAAIVDTASDSVVAKAPVSKAHNAGISTDGAHAFVASQATDAPAVNVVDIPSAAAGPAFALDASPRALAELNGKLYATVAGSGDIEVLDAASGAKTGSIPTGGSPHDIRPTLDGKLMLTVSQTAGELELVDPGGDSVVGRVATGKMPHWIGLSSNGAFAYVTDEGDNNVVVVDLSAQRIERTIAVGNAPRKIAVQP
jgi:YVTN family beta-propeller protein